MAPTGMREEKTEKTGQDSFLDEILATKAQRHKGFFYFNLRGFVASWLISMQAKKTLFLLTIRT